jgi:predicted aspartyl protease
LKIRQTLPACLGAAAMLAAGSAAWAADACRMHQVAELPVTLVRGKATVPVKINGHAAPFALDTGAAFTGVINADWAQRLGVKPRFRLGYRTKGMGGDQDLLDAETDTVTLGEMEFHHLAFVVAKGSSDDSLAGVVGASFLAGVDVEYDFAHGAVRLFRSEHCGDMIPAYWAKPEQLNTLDLLGSDSHDHGIVTDVWVNGQRMRALWDTGTPRSVLDLKAAARAGVTPKSEGATPGGKAGGFGPDRFDTWIAPFDSFALGREQISHTRLRMVDHEIGGGDMLLGLDFFLSHRIFVSQSQHKVYFTYNGGPVFMLDRLDPPTAPAPAADGG